MLLTGHPIVILPRAHARPIVEQPAPSPLRVRQAQAILQTRATNSSGREGRDYFWCKKVQEEKVLLAPTAPNRHSIQTSNRHKNNHVSTRNRSCIDVKSIGTISPSFLLLVSFFPLLAGAFPAVVSPEPEVGGGLDAALQEAGVEVGELEVGDGDGGIGKEA